MINWTKYFDRIYCQQYIPYTKRKQLMQFELNRVGILHSGIFEWQYTYGNNFDKKFNDYLKNKYHKKDYVINISLLLGHYKCIRDAYYKGYNRILVLEDDARFLRDLNKIEQILQHRPENANVVLYDKFVRNYPSMKQFKPINQYYSSFSSCRSTACYELDRVGMKKMMKLIETKPIVYDGYFWDAHYFLSDINHYSSNTNLVVQAIFFDSQIIDRFHGKPFYYQQWYKYQQITFDDYMMRKDGSPFYYGDYIEK